MLREGMPESGFVLFIILLFLFVLTLLVVSGSQNMILENKMQDNMKEHALVLARSEWGLQQVVFAYEDDPISLPDSPIQLKVRTKIILTDGCGNQTIDIRSTAHDHSSTVILNSRDIFAREPKLSGCKKIPAHQVIWWNEVR